MSGSASERVAVVTASARSLPALMCSMDDGMLSNMTCTCPPIRSVSAGAAAAIGDVEHIDAGHHLEQLAGHMGWRLPLPADAILILPGLALA